MNKYAAKLGNIKSLVTGKGTVDTARKTRQELKEKIDNWKKKAWLDFCKLIMKEDKRYTLMSMSDYNNRAGNNSMLSRVQNADGVFSNFCLTRTGELADVFLLPCEPMLGVSVDVGSKYTKATIQSFPSKAMIWPIIRIADELERQYIREVNLESSKHGNSLGGTHVKYNCSNNSYTNNGFNGTSTTSTEVSGDSNTNQLPTSS